MSTDIGFDAATPSLPAGGGAVSGLGETFTPDWSTGGGSFAIRIDTPNGPNDIGPRLRLRYDVGQGNGPFGLGFTVALPRLVRSTAHGYPRYDDTDPLMLEGAGELARVPGGFRPRVDGGAWRVSAQGDGFRLLDREGNRYLVGVDAAARLADANRVFAWHLQRIEDPLGAAVDLQWHQDQGQLYLDSLSYAGYDLRFDYEQRPDTLRDGRAGFLITTAFRCARITLRLRADAQPVLRRWDLHYIQHAANGSSLLDSVTLVGVGADGSTVSAPPVRMAWTAPQAPTLRRLETSDAGMAPGPLGVGRSRLEMVDWTGDGLPDVLEVLSSGRARVWPNLGGGRLGAPRTAGDLPTLGGSLAAVALADLTGDGLADVLRADQPLAEFVPRDPSGGFARPVTLAAAPSTAPDLPTVRFTDLDGDGILDLLSSGPGGYTVNVRDGASGWQARPHVVAPPSPEVAHLDDPRVFLADMTGDGNNDLVRVDGGGVSYWPYLGNGRWADRVRMADPPTLPAGGDPTRVLLADVDGDGCADVIVLDGDRVRIWLNRTGVGFAPERTIRAVPTRRMTDVRVVDMYGTGVAGLLWTMSGLVADDTGYYFLDPVGGAKPYLLASVDNGVGLVTQITYGTSAQEAARDLAAGTPWSTRMPVVLPVVTECRTTDAATGVTAVTRARYSEGRYDGVLREWAGFGVVEEEQLGDPSIPTLLIRRRFATGLDLDATDTPAEPRTMADRPRWRAVRGRLLQEERFSPDGSADAARPYDRLEQHWRVDSDGDVFLPRLEQTVRTTFERTANAVAVDTTENLHFDAAGNVIESVQTTGAPGQPGTTRTLRTVNAFAVDPAGRFPAKVWRTTQTDAAGALLADTVTVYDAQPDGQAGTQGLVTARFSLALTDDLVTEVYGAAPPAFGALGYVRRAGSAGWWAPQGSWTRVDDAGGLHGTATSALGGVTSFRFDDTRTVPVAVTDPFGNTVTAQPDLRTNRILRLTDAAGSSSVAHYDPLARLVATVEPRDTDAFPTRTIRYDTATVPVATTSATRAVAGQAAVITVTERHDGHGRLIERRMHDPAGDVRMAATVYNARGLVARDHLPARVGAAPYAVPGLDDPHTAYSYDALGRPVRQDNPDGSLRTTTYGPLLVVNADEEDTRAGGAHAGTTTTSRLDANGRLIAVEQDLAGRTLTSSYDYDGKGELVRHVDAVGHEVRMWHDLFGRVLRVDRPEASTTSVYDAGGNAVEGRTGATLLVTRVFDVGNRPVSMHYGPATSPATARFTYHDDGAVAPPDAGTHTTGGRCVRIDDEGGSVVFDYDERGQVNHKRLTPAAGGSYVLDFEHRSDGQLARITYPAAAPGGARLQVPYEYDARGLLSGIPSVAGVVEHDVAGRRSRLRLANGVEQAYDYEAATGRLGASRITGPGGTLREVTITRDLLGNVVGIASPGAELVSTFAYDDLYRLTAATVGGAGFTYRYDDAGAITFRSGVGDYHYGENGAPATCLTSAGADQFSWGALGAMASGPWGSMTYDGHGRMTSVTGNAGASSFTYDFAGLRVRATTPGHDRLTPDPLFAIEDGTLMLHLFDGVGVVARRNAATGGIAYLHADHLGGLALVTDAAGAVIDSLRFDPFGVLLERTGADPAQPFGFTGGEPDSSGLLLLGARWYAPEIGIFLSADPAVQNVTDPLAWCAYCYCRDNPTTLTDPTGRSFWGIFLAALAIVALIVVTILAVALDIISFGTLTAPLAIGIIALGLVVGGVIGGLAAYQKGGSTEDIITGVFVGAAVGGWAAFFSVVGGGAGAGVAGGMHLSGFWGAVVAGAVNGAISGAALGFAAGYAGGKGTIDDIFTKMWQGALVGLVAGAVIGGLAYAISPPTTSPWQDFRSAYNTPPPSAPTPGPGAPVGPPTPPVNDVGQAVRQVGEGLLLKGAGPVAANVGARLLTSGASPLVQAFVIDTSVGAWDLGYLQKLLERIGVIKVGGSF
jgi:RHS repeat-associated protein